MVDPDNEERLLKIPPHVVQAIKGEERTRIYRELKKIEHRLHWQDAIAFVKIMEIDNDVQSDASE